MADEQPGQPLASPSKPKSRKRRDGKSTKRSAPSSAGPGRGSDTVKVAVRVRPFNSREHSKQAKLCVSMDGRATTITDVTKTKAPRTFTFDHSYWSHDGFKEDGSGVYVGTNSTYASQQKIYEDLGSGMLDDAMSGYNAALFAYGQTGSGKSYSMSGYGVNHGVVPLMCQRVFERAATLDPATTEFQVHFSMLEIYNERVRDLLGAGGKARGSGLKIRQHPKHGFIVYGLNRVAVNSAEQILERIDAGNIARTTAATKMNETSSRSHMVITLQIKQVFNKGTPESTTKTSDIHMVDLAGSERADTSATGADADRLQEGSAINQSLSCLGNVISALADISTGKSVRVPYRDSVLTKLLQNALGGNSRTAMLATISPASNNYEESVSTLRYADRAKQIKNKAVVNESPTDKLIRELREENARLLQLIGKDSGGGSVAQSELEVNQSYLKEMETTWAEKLKAAEAQWKTSGANAHKTNLDGTYLENINEDPQLSGVLNHAIESGKTLVTRQTKSRPESATYDHIIPLGGLRIQPKHAVFIRKDGKVRVEPGDGKSEVLINGKRLVTPTTLKHSDRIHLAPNHIYKFVAMPKDRIAEKETIDFNFVLNEIAAAQGLGVVDDGNIGNVDIQAVREDVIALLPLVHEANAISSELQKPMVFDLVVKSGTSHNLTDKSKQVMVKVTNTETKHIWLWSKSKFSNRKFLMQELYELWIDGADIDPDKHKDPFWDPPEDYFLGSVYLYLQSLAYQIDIDETLAITNYQGDEEGQLHVSLCPCDATGRELSEDMFVSTPEELVGRRMDILVRIPWAKDLKWIQDDPTRGVTCRFKFYTDMKIRYTKTVNSKSDPTFDYTKQFTIKAVSNNFINYLEHNALVVEVWGTQGTGTMSLSPMPGAIGNADEAAMDAVTQEVDWIKEKKFLTERCAELQAEVDFLKIEKFALEKEMTRITIGGDTFMQKEKKESESPSGLEAQVKAFLEEDHTLRERLSELAIAKSNASESLSKQEINSVKDVISFQQSKVKELTKMLNETIDSAKKTVAGLSKK